MDRDERDEGIQYGGFWIRFVATLIDSILLILISYPLLLMLYGKDYFATGTIIKGPADFLISWVLPAVAIIVFWSYRSATPGKMICSLEIVDAKTGGKPSTGQFIGRYFAYFVSTIPFCIGFLWVAFDRRKQSWHDKLAGTVVVRKNKR
ncbi:MAG: RDD family protein [Deltaproteobacteria bacterium]|nr:RDD family protein [Deltaproteobacteria bacterium]MBN2846585.1 RDD family protein [Deltaproteobacteria bacterium]